MAASDYDRFSQSTTDTLVQEAMHASRHAADHAASDEACFRAYETWCCELGDDGIDETAAAVARQASVDAEDAANLARIASDRAAGILF